MVELIEQNQNTIRNWEARVTWVILERLGIASEFPQLKGCLVITSDEWASLSKLIERHRSRLQFQCRPLQFTEEVMVPVLYDQTAYGKEVGVLGEIAQADLVNFNQDLVELLKEQGQGLGEARNLVESFLNKIAHSLLILAA